LSAHTTYTYDGSGNQQTVKDALGHVSTTLYDLMNRATVQIDALGDRTTSTFDAAGLLLTATDAGGTQGSMVYDTSRRGLVASSIDAVGTGVQRNTLPAFNALGQATATRDALGFWSQMTFDGVGRESTSTDAGLGVSKSFYDLAGQLTAQRDQLGRLTQFH